MVKDSHSTSIKKRRKNVPVPDTDGEGDVYTKVVDFEEKESSQRGAEEDAHIYFELCKSIRKFLEEALVLKKESSPESRAKIQQGLTESCVMIAVLKKLNRLDKFRTIAGREALNIEKQKVDSTNLQYHNLLYESTHLLSEITKCKQFKSKDEEIELISQDEFFKDAGKSLVAPLKPGEEIEAYKHRVYLAMLEWELEQRKEQAKRCNTDEDEKKHLAADIIELKDRLEGIGPRLSAVLDASKPLQDYLGLPVDKIQAEHKLAYLLPEPLYLLYALADAYRQVYNINMNVEITGDYDEAHQWKEMHQSVNAKMDVESDQENDVQEAEEVVEVVKKRRHRKPSQVDKYEEKKKLLVEPHPLSVQITIIEKQGFILKMKFLFRPQLEIVTVFSSTDVPSNITGHTAREVLNGESLLNELLEGDFGLESPNPCNHYQLQKVGLGSFQTLVSKLGYPYGWAQKICGYSFLNLERNNAQNKPDPMSVELVMKMLYRRLKSRLDLAGQLQQLEQTTIPLLPDTVDFPRKTVSSLSKWASISWQNYCHQTSTNQLVENEVVSPTDLFYCATITRNKATLHALIAIYNNYPVRPPLFSLALTYNGDFHASNCDEIRDMERAVNIGWDRGTASASWLLSAQLHHLCAFLDVYLESSFPSAFPQITVFFKSVCARNRRRPFKYRKHGTEIFRHY